MKTYPRLVVLHTLSKAFGLAGVRCGTAIGSPATIHYMNAVKAPYSINKMTSCLAAEALSSPSLAALQAVVQGYAAGARATRGAARLLILRVHGLSLGRELFVGAPEAARQGEAALHEAGRERGGGPLSRRPGQFIRVHPRDRGDALRFGCSAEAAGRGRAGVWVGLSHMSQLRTRGSRTATSRDAEQGRRPRRWHAEGVRRATSRGRAGGRLESLDRSKRHASRRRGTTVS